MLTINLQIIKACGKNVKENQMASRTKELIEKGRLQESAKKAKEDLTIEQDKTKNLELSLKTTKLQHKDEIESYDSKLKEINKEKKLIEEKLLISTNTENLEEK
jgi:hypothetical protein